MKILVTGSNGLLGQHLIPRLSGGSHTLIALGRGRPRLSWDGTVAYHDLDISDHRTVRNFIRVQAPDVLVHAAAMTQVDDCERDREKTIAVNVLATENMLEACAGLKTHVIFLSTDFVFDGARGNYREEDPPNPVNWYGESKMLAEQKVAVYPGAWSIARTCLLYGIAHASSRSTIVSWIRDALEKKLPIRVVNDQVRTPTDVHDFARGIDLILTKRAQGIFHLSGEEIMTPYQLALAVADRFSLDKSLIEAVTAQSFEQPGRRPLKTGFVIDKARRVLGFSPVTLAAGLQRMD